MASTAQKSIIDYTAPAPDVGPMVTRPLDAMTPVFAGLQNWSRNFTTAHVTLQKEWLGFVERRLQQDVALPQRITACKAPDEAWRVYFEFLQAAVDDYRNEYLELARLGNATATDALSALQIVPPAAATTPNTKIQ